MFDNIGGKIKTLAKIICWIGIIGSVITAIIMFSAAGNSYRTEGTYIGLGFAFLIVGPLSSWIGSFFAYGFGELIEKTTEIAKNTRQTDGKSNTSAYVANNQTSEYSGNGKSSMHKWRCEKCGNMIDTTPCKFCGSSPVVDKDKTLDELLKAGLITQEEYNNKKKGIE